MLQALYKSNPTFCTNRLTEVINCAVQLETIHDSWKGSIINPIFKVGCQQQSENDCLFALLDTDTKHLAGLILAELTLWSERKNITPPNQTGFTQGGGTTTNILSVSILTDKLIKQASYLCFVDFKAAFDCVQLNLLWQKLTVWSIPPGLLKAIRMLYKGTWTRVRIGDGSF